MRAIYSHIRLEARRVFVAAHYQWRALKNQTFHEKRLYRVHSHRPHQGQHCLEHGHCDVFAVLPGPFQRRKRPCRV